MKKVAILLDKDNNWLEKFLPPDLFQMKNYSLKVFHNLEHISSFDFVFVLGFTKILKRDFLSRNKMVMIIHESELPKGKGFSPIQWQILEGENEIKVCLINAAEKVDSGEILETEKLIFDGSELYDEIRESQARVSFKLIRKFLKKYPNNSKCSQIGNSTYYRKRTKKDSELNINDSIKDSFPKLRIGNNEEWPSFFKLNGVTYILKIYKKD